MAEANIDEAALKRRLLELDVILCGKQIFWETPRAILLIVVTTAVVTATIAGVLSWKISSEPRAITVHLEGPLRPVSHAFGWLSWPYMQAAMQSVGTTARMVSSSGPISAAMATTGGRRPVGTAPTSSPASGWDQDGHRPAPPLAGFREVKVLQPADTGYHQPIVMGHVA
jgi:hypothetical protein